MADTFTCQWINRLDQFGSADIDLLITHDQGVMPDKRISKNYQGDPDAVFLESEAVEEVAKYIVEWNEANPP